MTPDAYDSAPWPNRLYNITVMGPDASRRMQKRRKPVNGYLCWPFASRRHDGGGWSLDHTPTGASLGVFDRLRDAKEAARALVAETGGTQPWEAFTEPKHASPEVKDALKAVMRPVVRVG